MNNFEYAYHTLGLPVGDAMEWAKKRTPGYGGAIQQSSSYRFDFFVNGPREFEQRKHERASKKGIDLEKESRYNGRLINGESINE